MSDVSYPVPIRKVIIGGKTWNKCHLAEIFRRARLKLVPDPPVVGYLPDLRESFPTLHEPFEPKNPDYSPQIAKLFDVFQIERKLRRTNTLYLYSKSDISDKRRIEDTLMLKALPGYWTPRQLEKHLDLFDEGYVHQVLITLDLNKSFNVQLQNNGLNPETFDDWSVLTEHPINCVEPYIAQKREKAKPTLVLIYKS